MSLKIIQINASYKPAYIYGGPTMSVSKLCEVLTTKEGVDLEVLTTTANGKTELPVATDQRQNVEGVDVRYFKRITKDHSHFSPSLLKYLRRKLVILKRNQPEQNLIIVHIQAWWNLVSMLSCQIAKWQSIPVVLSPRGMITSYTLGNRNALSKRLLHSLMGKSLLEYCHFHVTSEKERQDVLKITKAKSITVIPNILNLPAVDATSNGTKNENFQIIYLSRIEEKKGLELLFNALAKVTFKWTLKLGGSGDPDYVNGLKKLSKDLIINRSVEWLGQVSNTDKFNLLARQDLMVLTSYNENFANVVIESLSVGTAVLISEEVGLSDYVSEKQLGWISTLETDHITQKLEDAFKGSEKRKEIRQNAPQIIALDFAAEALSEQYMHMYKSILSPKSKI